MDISQREALLRTRQTIALLLSGETLNGDINHKKQFVRYLESFLSNESSSYFLMEKKNYEKSCNRMPVQEEMPCK